jgi:ABC-type dipeptide/oligopeptide/nickel transport system ATPase component
MESLNPVFTVGGQLREFIELNRDLSAAEAREEAVEMLREVGIPEPEARYDDYPHQFSGGMRQRILIAMALACGPALVVADEPTTALDVTVEAQILDLVDDLQDRYDTSFVWVTHDMGVVAEICDRVNVMYLGEIVEHATVDDLFHDSKHPYTEALLASLPRPSGDRFRLLDSVSDHAGPPEATAGDETEPSRLVAILLWVVALPVAVHYVGFLLATPAFLFGFVGYLRGDWWLAAKVSALVTGVLLTLLVSLLQAQLFGGVLDPLGAIPA